MQVNT